MNSIEMKKSRGPNFNSAEIMLLLELVQKYPVIENKRTDGATTKEKELAWQSLAAEYNSLTSFAPRTAHKLLSCYKNQKSKVKKHHSNEKMSIKAPLLLEALDEYGQDWDRVAQETQLSSSDCQTTFNYLVKEAKRSDATLKKEINRTGGGPPPHASVTDPVIEKVKTLIGPSLEGLYTQYDGDSDFMKEQQAFLPSDERTQPIEVEIMEESAPDQKLDKRLNIMKRKKDPSLELLRKEKKKVNVSHSFQELADDKKELVKAQKTLAFHQIEHEQLMIELTKEKLLFEKEKNKIELEFLKQKYELELVSLKNK